MKNISFPNDTPPTIENSFWNDWLNDVNELDNPNSFYDTGKELAGYVNSNGKFNGPVFFLQKQSLRIEKDQLDTNELLSRYAPKEIDVFDDKVSIKVDLPYKIAYYKNGVIDGPTFYFKSDQGKILLDGNLKPMVDTVLRYLDGILQETEFYENGKIKEKTVERGDRKGLYVTYYENGQVKESGTFVGEKKSGNWQVYDEQGMPISEAEYDNGHLHGVVVNFTDGLVIEKTQYRYGLLDGIRMERVNEVDIVNNNIAGLPAERNIVRETSFAKGIKEGVYKEYINNTLITQGYYKNNLRTGEWNYFDLDGKSTKIENFQEGELHGLTKVINTKQVIESNFDNGTLDGPQKYFTPGSSVPYFIEIFEKGVPNKYVVTDVKGNPIETGEYNGRVPHGNAFKLINGSWEPRFYDNGKLVTQSISEYNTNVLPLSANLPRSLTM